MVKVVHRGRVLWRADVGEDVIHLVVLAEFGTLVDPLDESKEGVQTVIKASTQGVVRLLYLCVVVSAHHGWAASSPHFLKSSSISSVVVSVTLVERISSQCSFAKSGSWSG